MTHICNHGEEGSKPVTPENGISLKYPVEGMELELYLHHACAAAWSSQFAIPLTADTTLLRLVACASSRLLQRRWTRIDSLRDRDRFRSLLATVTRHVEARTLIRQTRTEAAFRSAKRCAKVVTAAVTI